MEKMKFKEQLEELLRLLHNNKKFENTEVDKTIIISNSVRERHMLEKVYPDDHHFSINELYKLKGLDKPVLLSNFTTIELINEMLNHLNTEEKEVELLGYNANKKIGTFPELTELYKEIQTKSSFFTHLDYIRIKYPNIIRVEVSDDLSYILYPNRDACLRNEFNNPYLQFLGESMGINTYVNIILAGLSAKFVFVEGCEYLEIGDTNE